MENKNVFALPVGLSYNGTVEKEVELLRTNGVAEKMIKQKTPDKPYTWQAGVICAAVRRIGPYEIAVKAREEFIKTQAIVVPPVVGAMTLADMNTCLVEVHRRVWKSPFIKGQQIVCKMCSRVLKGDVDLTRIDYSEEDKEFMGTGPDYSQILVYLQDGFSLEDTPLAKVEGYEEFGGVLYNKLIFRPPLVRDAIANEAYVNDEVEFWRKIATSCLVGVYAVENGDTKEEREIMQLPEMGFKLIGKKLYDEVLLTNDLDKVREELQGFLPTLPFMYDAICGCDKKYTIPWTMEATNFF